MTQSREISAASRLENVRYAIRDLACVADEVTQAGTQSSAAERRRSHHLRFPDAAAHHRSRLQSHARWQERIRAVSGSSRSAGSHSRRGRAQGHHHGAGRIRHLRRQRDRGSLPLGAGQSRRGRAHAQPRLSAVLGRALQAGHRAERLRPERRRRLAAGTGRHRAQDHSAHPRRSC